MDEPSEIHRGKGRSVRSVLILLLLFAGVVHAEVLGRTVVAARDGIGYIRYALLLERQPWPQILPHLEQHPGYPLFVELVSLPVRGCLGLTPDAMMLSARLASSIAAVGLVVPMFFLGRELTDRRTAFWAALLFSCLPVAAHVASDALSEALFLFFAAGALLFAAQGLRLRSPLRFALCGCGGGLAYLTRPEGLVIPAAAGVVLLLLPLLRWRGWSWRPALGCTTALVLAATATAGPYVVTIGGLTVKPSALRMLGTLDRDDDWLNQSAPDACRITARPLTAVCGVWLQESERRTVVWGFQALLAETVRAFAGVFAVAALIGIGVGSRRLLDRPAWWVVLLSVGVVWLLLLRLAVVNGYVSERHLLLVLMCGCYPAAAALIRCADLAVSGIVRWFGLRSGTRWQSFAASSCMGLTVLACLPSALKPLHANRLGHRAAGEWLAQHAQSADPILDPLDWASFYAGRMVTREAVEELAAKHGYVVLEGAGASHSHLPLLARAVALAARGRLVYEWQPSAPERLRDRAEAVAVYEVAPEK